MIALLSPQEPNGNWTRLCNQVIGAVSLENIGIFQTVDSFIQRLKQGKTDITAAVIFATCREELQLLQALTDIVSDIRIILILPDREPETTRIGHTFYPRYISYVESSFEDVAAVLNKIIDNNQTWAMLSIPP